MATFDDTVAIVTGAGAGIGRATALALGAAGARVAVAEIDAASGIATARALTDGGTEARFVACDVGDEQQVDELFASVDHALGPVGVLINCAGGSQDNDEPVDQLNPTVFDQTIARDLRGTMLTARRAIGHMRRLGGGSIVNFASYTAVHGSSDSHAYVAAKGGVISLTRALAVRYAQDGIRANAIAPGIVLTERVRHRVDEAAVDLDAIRKTHPFAVTSPESIAAIALFLAGPDSAPITGAIVPADGGLTLF